MLPGDTYSFNFFRYLISAPEEHLFWTLPLHPEVLHLQHGTAARNAKSLSFPFLGCWPAQDQKPPCLSML